MARKKAKTEKYFLLDSGEEYRVTGEDGVYWYCEAEDGHKTQFRKAANRGKVMREEAAEPQEAPAEENQTEGE